MFSEASTLFILLRVVAIAEVNVAQKLQLLKRNLFLHVHDNCWHMGLCLTLNRSAAKGSNHVTLRHQMMFSIYYCAI